VDNHNNDEDCVEYVCVCVFVLVVLMMIQIGIGKNCMELFSMALSTMLNQKALVQKL
jgi:hypothetical protein